MFVICPYYIAFPKPIKPHPTNYRSSQSLSPCLVIKAKTKTKTSGSQTPLLIPTTTSRSSQNPDGTITPIFQYPITTASPDPNTNLSQVLTKDVPLNPTRNTWIRIFLPYSQAMKKNSPAAKKHPLVVYYHGGGFILSIASSLMHHDFCSQMAAGLSAVVVSVEYCLAPEHRLPAAYEATVEALRWIKSAEDMWLREFYDVFTCFLMGTSAGDKIGYHAGLRASSAVDELLPLRTGGMILHHPFFRGVGRSGSEVRLVIDPVLPLSGSYLMWELALPIGITRIAIRWRMVKVQRMLIGSDGCDGGCW